MATIRKKTWKGYFDKIISGKKKFEVVATYIFKTKGQTFWPPGDVEKYGFQIIQFEPK